MKHHFFKAALSAISLASAFFWSSIAAADSLAFHVPNEFRICAETPYNIGEEVFREDGKMVAFPYWAGLEEAPEVILVPSENTNDIQRDLIETSCSGFKVLSSNLDLIFDYDETYPLRVGYYAWVELLLKYSEAEASSRRIGRSFYYVAAAAEALRDAASACLNFPSSELSLDRFCNKRDLVQRAQLIQQFQRRLVSANYTEEEVNPDAVLEFDRIVSSSLAQVDDISAKLPD
ncbi:hypothetical protein [Ruegeria sp. MALMAid1280]|uniref:hypothetical protein n=1 Tax=Ruegeria sp. MALMAid1280 TaxID=3411634 RepID=UPI003BA05CA5